MVDKAPYISIITVCFNSAKFIEEAINSVHEQQYKNREHIVIDGGSTDGTVNILQKFQQQQVLRFVSEPDGGIYEAMNKGIKLATGKWIFFLGSDDVFFDNEVLKRVFSENINDELILYGNVKFLHSGIKYDGPFDHEKISMKNICHQAILFRKDIFTELGFFNVKYKIYADYEFNIRWMGAKTANKYINETLVIYNEIGVSGRIIDEIFLAEFNQILIKNDIVCARSIAALKTENSQLRTSHRYKIGSAIIKPFSWMKNKIINQVWKI